MGLRADELSVGYGDRAVLDALTCEVQAGRITAIVGANASGKSTLLRTMARLLDPGSGTVMLDGDDVHRLPSREVAKRLGLLVQGPVAPEGLTVRDLVRRGRYPHQRALRGRSDEDERLVDWALGATETTDLDDRPLDQLSGGQLQRVWIAMALAQGTPVLLLDEPTTYLDLAHQLDVLELLERLNREDGRTIALVLHDVNQAARHAHHLIAMRDGKVVAAGPPAEVVTVELIAEVFGVEARVVDDPVTGTPMCVPVGRVSAVH